MFKTLGLLLFLIVSLPAHSADNLKRSCGVLINSGGNTFLFYNKSGIKEFETNKKDKQLMLKKYSCACMSYKYKNEEYIRGITKVEFVNENFCSRQKEIGEIYVSKIDRAGYGMPPAGIDNEKSNKLYLGYDYTPRLENKFFFYKGDVTTIYTFEKYGVAFAKFGVCSLDGKTMKCRRYYESGIEKGRLSEEINYVYVKGNYVEEGVHVIYDRNGDVAFIEINNRNYKKDKVLFDRYPEKTKRSFYFS
ncbi:hypothetical protein ACLED3_16800 [Lonsdalea quercina]|uniref:hypothetical protein n=1 Tax=Lonsdalea quercina TaxID=71657 RepID=UPI003974DF99